MMQSGQKNESDSIIYYIGNKFAVLFHGPEVFDKGYAKRIIKLIPGASFYQAGTMGRTAAYDHNLENVISIPDLPGKVIRESIKCDALMIIIYPKSEFSGQSFVRIILDNAKLSIPVMHVDCRTGMYVVWQGKFHDETINSLEELGFVQGNAIPPSNLFSFENNLTTRHLQACEVGDFVLCNNLIIGKATSENVTITTKDGKIITTSGLEVKEHGLEKLGKINLLTAKCCSTQQLRDDSICPRVTRKEGKGVAFINHCAADVYDLTRHCEGAVAVGDDTSRIVGDILYRFSMPVYAITDGDWDKLIIKERFFPGSVVVEVEHDDAVGEEVYDIIFNNNLKLDISFDKLKDKLNSFLEDKIVQLKNY